MSQLSEHFTIEEATFSSTAQRLGIANVPDEEKLAHMKLAAVRLEEVRNILRAPIHIDSWYRSPELNKAVGGSPSSAHKDGFAIDFICPSFGTPKQIAEAIVGSCIIFDQCIQEGNWLHISFAPTMRMQALTAHFDAAGKAIYSNGLA